MGMYVMTRTTMCGVVEALLYLRASKFCTMSWGGRWWNSSVAYCYVFLQVSAALHDFF